MIYNPGENDLAKQFFEKTNKDKFLENISERIYELEHKFDTFVNFITAEVDKKRNK